MLSIHQVCEQFDSAKSHVEVSRIWDDNQTVIMADHTNACFAEEARYSARQRLGKQTKADRLALEEYFLSKCNFVKHA